MCGNCGGKMQSAFFSFLHFLPLAPSPHALHTWHDIQMPLIRLACPVPTVHLDSIVELRAMPMICINAIGWTNVVCRAIAAKTNCGRHTHEYLIIQNYLLPDDERRTQLKCNWCDALPDICINVLPVTRMRMLAPERIGKLFFLHILRSPLVLRSGHITSTQPS